MTCTLTTDRLAQTRREVAAAAGRVARRSGLTAHDREDLEQDLLVGLLAAIARYDATRGTFGAFAGRVINRQAMHFYRRRARDTERFGTVSLDQPAGDDERPLIELLSMEAGLTAALGQRADDREVLERRLDLKRTLNRLSADDRQLCVALAATTPSAFCAAHGIARATFYRRLGRLRATLVAAGLRADA